MSWVCDMDDKLVLLLFYLVYVTNPQVCWLISCMSMGEANPSYLQHMQRCIVIKKIDTISVVEVTRKLYPSNYSVVNMGLLHVSL
jgi:hypothetical protein